MFRPYISSCMLISFFFFFNDTATTEIYTLSLHDALPILKLKDFSFDDAVAGAAPLVIVAAGLQDPGNLGTILRSAEAFGATGVLTAEKTVSHLNAKVIRAAAGSLFRLPVMRVESGDAVKK